MSAALLGACGGPSREQADGSGIQGALSSADQDALLGDQTLIWFHGRGQIRSMKDYIGFTGNPKVFVPNSPTEIDATAQSQAYDWQVGVDPWPRAMPEGSSGSLTVSGFSLGRRALFEFIHLHGADVTRAILFDPSYEYEFYDGKLGFEIVADWMAGDPSRTFTFVHGPASTIVNEDGRSAMPNFKQAFFGKDDLFARVFVLEVGDDHLDVIPNHRDCFRACGASLADSPLW